MNKNRMNLRLFDNDAQLIDRTGAESLIPVQESNEIIQGVVSQSAVLTRGKKLANMTSKQYKMPVLDMLPIAYFVNGDTGQKQTTKQASGAFITNATPAIAFKVTDEDSGINESTIKLTVDGSAVASEEINKKAVSGGYECTYTPKSALGNGAHTIKVEVSDHDGNAAAAQTVSFTVDTVPPTLSVTAPVEGYVTNQARLLVSGTTDDATSKPVTVTVNGEKVAVNENGTWSKTITLSPGANTITVVATDKAGKSTTVTRKVTLDTGAPVFVSAKLTPNPVDAGKTFIISVEVTD